MRRRRESGEGNVGCLIWAVIFGIVLLIGWKAVPVKIKTAELYDFMDDQARYTKKGEKAQDQVKQAILAKADSLELPLKADDLTVSRKRDNVTITFEYVVPLEFPGKTYEWEFAGKIDRPSFVY
jgi:hypothetical protein